MRSFLKSISATIAALLTNNSISKSTSYSKVFEIESFSNLDIKGELDVEVLIQENAKYDVTLFTNQENFKFIQIELIRGYLRCRYNKYKFFRSEKTLPLLRITMPSPLVRAKFEGHGSLEVKGLNQEKTIVDINGSGYVYYEGKIDELDIEILGDGDFDGRNLKVRQTGFRLKGSATAEINTEVITGQINGSGDLYLDKETESFVKIFGDGEIHRRTKLEPEI